MRIAMLTALLMATVSPAAALSISPEKKDADPTVLIGLSVGLGSSDIANEIGFTVKGFSSNAEDHVTFGGGVGYYPWSEQTIGLDLGVGYNFSNSGIFGGYDILKRQPTISVGYVPTVNTEAFCPDELTLSGGECLGGPDEESDRRLKKAIMPIVTLANGIRLYAFRYKWSDELNVGVMAQDLLHHPIFGGAVRRAADGYFRVDYAALGLRMATYDDWKKRGLSAITAAPNRKAAA